MFQLQKKQKQQKSFAFVCLISLMMKNLWIGIHKYESELKFIQPETQNPKTLFDCYVCKYNLACGGVNMGCPKC